VTRHNSREGAIHAAQGSKSAVESDGLDIVGGFEQPAASQVDADPFDEIRRTDIQAGSK